ncbi:helix-turn-helix domain-containing protein [Nonomuraea bangladeshensis]
MSVRKGGRTRRNLATPEEVAEYLGVAEATLRQWRWLRKGPDFGTVGRHIRYDWDDVETYWAKQKQQCGGAA